MRRPVRRFQYAGISAVVHLIRDLLARCVAGARALPVYLVIPAAVPAGWDCDAWGIGTGACSNSVPRSAAGCTFSPVDAAGSASHYLETWADDQGGLGDTLDIVGSQSRGDFFQH